MAIRRNSFINLAGSLVGLLLFAALTPLYFHVIGSERYGILAIINVFLTFFAVFDFGMGSALTYRIASEPGASVARQADYFWTAMAVSLPIGGLTGAALFGLVGGGFGNLFGLTPAISAELFRSAPALLGIGVCTILLSTIGGLLRGREFFAANAVLGALGLSLAILLPVLAALIISPSLNVLILAMFAGRVIVVLSAMAVAQIAILRGTSPRVSMRSARALAGYGAWTSVSGLIELAISAADRLILGAVAGSAAVAYYAIPSSAVSRVMVFPSSLTQAALPQLASRSVAEEAVLAQKITRMVATLTPLFVGGMFLARPVLTIWMGPAFAAAATLPMQWLLVGFWVETIALIPYYRLLARGRPRANTIVAAVVVLPYCALLFFLSRYAGVAGAAAAYLCRNLFYLIGRTAFTRSAQSLLPAIAPQAALVFGSLAVCLVTMPNQPPLPLIALLVACSLVLMILRRPAELDTFLRDFATRLRPAGGIPHPFRRNP